MKRILFLFVLLSCLCVMSQEVLNNDSILSMVEMDFGEALIIDKIENSDCSFDTTISVLGNLKKKGVSNTILSAMTKSSKKEKETNGEVNQSNNLQYTFSEGVNSHTVHLVKNEYFKTFKGSELEALIRYHFIEARLEVKNKSTYVPKRIGIDINNKEEPVIVITGTAQNDYGGTKDITYLAKFSYDVKTGLSQHNPTSNFFINNKVFSLSEYEKRTEEVNLIDYRNDEGNLHFYYKYMTFDGKKYKVKGEVFINDNYYVITTEPSFGIETPDTKSPLFKKVVNENEWSCKYAYENLVSVTTYNSLPNKYKSTGGTLTLDGQDNGLGSVKMIYYLSKEK